MATESKAMMETVHKLVTGILAAGVLGGLAFVQETKTEIALLKHEVAEMSAVSDKILSTIERVHPRQ